MVKIQCMTRILILGATGRTGAAILAHLPAGIEATAALRDPLAPIRVPAGSELTIHGSRSLEDDNGMGVFECHLQGPGIQAEARLNVFRPPQPAVYLQEQQEQSHD